MFHNIASNAADVHLVTTLEDSRQTRLKDDARRGAIQSQYGWSVVEYNKYRRRYLDAIQAIRDAHLLRRRVDSMSAAIQCREKFADFATYAAGVDFEGNLTDPLTAEELYYEYSYYTNTYDLRFDESEWDAVESAEGLQKHAAEKAECDLLLKAPDQIPGGRIVWVEMSRWPEARTDAEKATDQ
jgi:hypothetical protein